MQLNDESPRARTADSISQARLALVLGLVSFATVAFLLCVFRLLTFFIMPSIFFDLLFIGFPVGALLGVRYFQADLRSFRRSLIVLETIMFVSMGLCLLCKQADYLRATFYNLSVGRLFLQILTFSTLFFPFFCAYGLSEYVGYQYGRSVLRGHMRWVYSAYLFGAALAYLAVHFGLRAMGVAPTMLWSIALISLAVAALGRNDLWNRAHLVLIVALAVWPGLEPTFLNWYKGEYFATAPMSTKGLAQATRGWKQLHQRWGHFALCELMRSPNQKHLSGFYNDVFQWSYTRPSGLLNETERVPLDAFPFFLTPEQGRVLIVGAGGGRQVRFAARHFSFREILAVEIEPEVFRMTRQLFASAFDRVYEAPNVVPICAEGRTFLERDPGPFDLIFMPSVGGYPQMMLEPGNMIRTREAYTLMKNRLTATGVLAVWYPIGLDREGILTRHYIDTFRQLGLHVAWYGRSNPDDILILASPVKEQTELSYDRLREFAENEMDITDPEWVKQQMPTRITYPENPDFNPITDERPFLAGNVRNLMTTDQVARIYGIVMTIVAVLTVVFAIRLRESSRAAIAGIPAWLLVLTSFLVGANFLVMERALVIALFQRSYVFYDSLRLGAILFLVLSGLGSMLIRPAYKNAACLMFVGCCLALLAARGWTILNVAALAGSAFALGSFFPAVFEAARRNPLPVFAFDAVGAASGSATAFFLQIVLGLSNVYLLAGTIGLATVVCMQIFTFRLSRSNIQPG